MTEAADLVFLNGEVHTLEPAGDRTHEAVAVRDGRVVRVGPDYEVRFLEGVDTRRVDLDGRTLLPGFVDAHTHLEQFGRHLVHADLSAADSREEAVDRLRAEARRTEPDDAQSEGDGEPGDGRGEWILGFGYDETDWGESDYLTRGQLDEVSDRRPVVAMRVDLHTASLNSVALDRLRGEMPDGDVHTRGGEPTGVVVESAAGVVRDATAPDPEGTRRLLTAARDRAHELGVTGVHDMVRESHAPRVYRELDRAGELDLRVRINYWSDHLAAAVETGLRTNHGSESVRVGGIKTFTDGSIGGRTAKVSEPYADYPDDGDSTDGSDDGTGGAEGDRSGADTRDGDPTGQWVVDPDRFRSIVERAHREGFQACAHAIGDEAIEETLSAYESLSAGSGVDGERRHRIEHAELATDDQIERMAAADVVASCQPNFHRWAREDGLYAARLGDRRRLRSNRLGAMHDAGVELAFGSDCMPLDPLLGIHHAVTAPAEDQRLGVTEALRAYTLGSARAGFDEDRLGTVEPGKCADFTILERSPWDHPGSIDGIDVAATVVGGDVVYDAL